METTKSIVIGAPLSRVYEACTDLESLPRVLANVRSIERTGEQTSHWVAESPSGGTVEWDAELTRMETDKRIAWHTRDNGDDKTSGQITFNALPNDQTEVTLVIKVLSKVAEAEVEKMLDENLRKLKTSVENT